MYLLLLIVHSSATTITSCYNTACYMNGTSSSCALKDLDPLGASPAASPSTGSDYCFVCFQNDCAHSLNMKSIIREAVMESFNG